LKKEEVETGKQQNQENKIHESKLIKVTKNSNQKIQFWWKKVKRQSFV